MASAAAVDYAGTLKVSALLNTTNINTNSASAAFDVSPYIGNLMVVTTVGNGAATATIVPSLKAGADTNVSNATNWVLNIANFSEAAGMNVCNVDLRSSAFGGATNKYLYLTWIGVGVGFNTALTATIIGQQKYSS